MQKRLVWDIPTRLFHWLLVLSLCGQYVTAELMDNAMQWHFYLGYFTLGLIVFRIIWGFAGPQYARFSNFVRGPVPVIHYIKTLPNKHSTETAGHNPLGGWVVVLMLVLVAVQAVSGLFMTDDIFLDGPYRHTVSDSALSIMNTLHHNAFNILLAVIALHIAAIAFYAIYKKQSLTPPMIHGKKATNSPGISSSRLLLAVIVIAIVAAIVYAGVEVLPPEPVDDGFYY